MSYLLRSDGVADRIKHGKVSDQINPPPDTKFIAVSAGWDTSYLVSDNGLIHRVKGGKVVQSFAPTNDPVQSGGCNIL